MPLKFLTRIQIEEALNRLSELAAAEGVRLEMTLYGGALMLLAYDSRDVTKDIDAIVYPTKVAERLAKTVQRELGLHDGWLNSDVKQFLSPHERKNSLVLPNICRDGLHITRPTGKYLLAMKVMACRKPLPGYLGDHEDLVTLLRITKTVSIEQIQRIVDDFFPDSPLLPETALTLQSLLVKARDPHAS